MHTSFHGVSNVLRPLCSELQGLAKQAEHVFIFLPTYQQIVLKPVNAAFHQILA